VRGQRVEFVFKRNRVTLAPARRRTTDGEQLGGQGRHAEAYAAFQEAARLDPFDPHPRYLSGLALLHLRRYAEAVAEYEVTERLAPGWFNCRADLWLARELARGAIDHELFRIVYQLEDAPVPPREKVGMAEAALRVAPRLAPLHLFHGRSLDALGATAAAETAYRNGSRLRSRTRHPQPAARGLGHRVAFDAGTRRPAGRGDDGRRQPHRGGDGHDRTAHRRPDEPANHRRVTTPNRAPASIRQSRRAAGSVCW
jgi:tetratricopeptide (TPR) repeat protein